MKVKILNAIFFRLLRRIAVGSLTVRFAGSGGEFAFGVQGAEPHGIMDVYDDSVFAEALTQGEFALGMGYVNGKWDSPSAYHVLLVFLLNEERFRRPVSLLSKLDVRARILRRSIERRTRNTIENCRREIGVTYDIGNAFYEMMLGPSMTYTCAIWPRPDATLEEAQEHKMRLVCEKAMIRGGHRVLDIGCGWGSLCRYIHETTGAQVKGIALSREQIAWCRDRHPHLEFEYLDYREIDGVYDSIVSVGMAEHVGALYWDAFMGKVRDHLKDGGRFVLHTMVYHGNDIFKAGGKAKYMNFSSVLMPNADAPTPSMIVRAAMRTGSLRLVHYETFGVHYTRTAQAWLENMQRNRDGMLASFPEKLYRAHEYSWHMGGACMETGTSLLQAVFEKKPYGSCVRESIL